MLQTVSYSTKAKDILLKESQQCTTSRIYCQYYMKTASEEKNRAKLKNNNSIFRLYEGLQYGRQKYFSQENVKFKYSVQYYLQYQGNIK